MSQNEIMTLIGRALRIGDPEMLGILAELSERQSHPADVGLCSAGDRADRLFVIESGEVELTLPVPMLSESRGVAIERVGSGRLVGWSALTSPFHYSLSVWTVVPVVTLTLSGERILEACEGHREAGFQLYRELSHIVGERLSSLSVLLQKEIEHGVHQRRRGAFE